MRWTFADLSTPAARDAWLRQKLAGVPLATASDGRGPRVGGRIAALAELHRYDSTGYAKGRNFLGSAVSRLSPYLRHGMVTTLEVRDHLRGRYAQSPEVVEEFLKQLTWRDFFEKVLDWYGAGLEEDLETAKHRVARKDALPDDVAAGATGLPCMDSILFDLTQAGYVHNHERLWFAAYLTHFRGVSWKQGAKLFRQYLYDGDWASNNSSWQWVESSFANKPYFMNQENVQTFSHDKWCSDCRAACPFRASYEELQHRLFDGNEAPLARHKGKPFGRRAEREPVELPMVIDDAAAPVKPTETAVWVHDAMLSPDDATLKAFPDAALVFVFDENRLAAEPWAFHRYAFVLDGLAELFAARPGVECQIRFGDPGEELREFVRETGAKVVATTDSPNPGVRPTLESLKGVAEVRTSARPELTTYSEEPKRFMRFWDKVSDQVLGYSKKAGRKSHRR